MLVTGGTGGWSPLGIYVAWGSWAVPSLIQPPALLYWQSWATTTPLSAVGTRCQAATVCHLPSVVWLMTKPRQCLAELTPWRPLYDIPLETPLPGSHPCPGWPSPVPGADMDQLVQPRAGLLVFACYNQLRREIQALLAENRELARAVGRLQEQQQSRRGGPRASTTAPASAPAFAAPHFSFPSSGEGLRWPRTLPGR